MVQITYIYFTAQHVPIPTQCRLPKVHPDAFINQMISTASSWSTGFETDTYTRCKIQDKQLKNGRPLQILSVLRNCFFKLFIFRLGVFYILSHYVIIKA